jgi:hypothetical protein
VAFGFLRCGFDVTAAISNIHRVTDLACLGEAAMLELYTYVLKRHKEFS